MKFLDGNGAEIRRIWSLNDMGDWYTYKVPDEENLIGF